MSALPQNYNLCLICLLAESCQCIEKSTGMMTVCADFKLDIRAFNNLRTISESKINIHDEELPANGRANAGLMGLCNFCNKRDTCQLPKPEGGIWHCRDFSQ